MPRLIAFGCSNTFGEGLSDCWVRGSVASQPSKFAWPNVLGSLLDIDEVVNMALPAISNKQIWLNAMEFDYQDGDIVFLHWTFIDRDCFFDNIPVIGPWNTNVKNVKMYYKYFYSETDRYLDFYNRSDHVHRYLKSKNIKQFHFQTHGESDLGKEIQSQITRPLWFGVKILPLSIPQLSNDHGRALDGKHPGHETHIEFANNIFNFLKSNKEI